MDTQRNSARSEIDGSGLLAVVEGCVSVATSPCMVRDPSFHRESSSEAERHPEIKLVIAAVYSNFRTHIVDDDGIEQADGYTTGPKSNQLFLRFEKIVDQ